MGDLPFRTPRHHRLGGPLPRQLTNATHAHPLPKFFNALKMPLVRAIGYQSSFRKAVPEQREGCIRVTHPSAARQQVLLLLLPLDLHVLGLPLAFILSQDQTLRCINSYLSGGRSFFPFFVSRFLCLTPCASCQYFQCAWQNSFLKFRGAKLKGFSNPSKLFLFSLC